MRMIRAALPLLALTASVLVDGPDTFDREVAAVSHVIEEVIEASGSG